MSTFTKYMKPIVEKEKPDKMLIARADEHVLDELIGRVKNEQEITFREFLVLTQIFQKMVDVIVHINNYSEVIRMDINPMMNLEEYVFRITGRKICAYTNTIPEMKEILKGFNFDIEIKEVETFSISETKGIIQKIKESRK